MGGVIKGLESPITILSATVVGATPRASEHINTGNHGEVSFYVDYTINTDTGIVMRYQVADRLDVTNWYHMTNNAGTMITTNITATGRYRILQDVNDGWVRVVYWGATSGAPPSGSVAITAVRGDRS